MNTLQTTITAPPSRAQQEPTQSERCRGRIRQPRIKDPAISKRGPQTFGFLRLTKLFAEFATLNSIKRNATAKADHIKGTS